MKNNDDSAGNRAGDKRPRSAGDSTGGTEGKRARGEGDGGRTCPACKRTFGSGIDMRQHYSCKQDAVHVEHRRLHVRQEDKDEEARPLGGMAPAPALQAHAAAPVVKANPSARTSSTTLSQMTAARFADLTINPLTKKAIAEVLRYETMTLVQQQSLPVALSGVDVLAKAKTGTGKTLSFLLPALEAALRPPSGGPRIKILIVSPTRELASQIYEEGQMVCKFHSGFKLMCIYGGTNMNKDINGFKAPPDLLVATPGRLNDHLQSSGLDGMMLGLRVLILDEADQLLDMGFRPAILDMLSRLPPKESRQTLLFSATMPNDVQSIAKIGMRANYSFVDTVGEEENTHEHVPQHYLITSKQSQAPELLGLVQEAMQEPNYKVIVFFTTARLTQFYAELFQAMGLGVLEIHSRRSQSQRNKVSDQFRDGTHMVLFSSDVSARGMDYPDVSAVIQVGQPTDKAQYIHRLGRTARAGKHGCGVLVLCDFEQGFLRDIQDLPVKQRAGLGTGSSFQVHAGMMVKNGLARLPRQTTACAYQAWLGFYNSLLRKLGWTKEELVRQANDLALKCWHLPELPQLEAKTVGKMGLKDVPGLSISRGAGGGGGGRGGGGNGGWGGGKGRGRGVAMSLARRGGNKGGRGGT